MNCYGQQQRGIQNTEPTARVPTARPSHQPVSLTYRALLGKLHQSAYLLADLGIGAQDVIALLLPDMLETHLLLWGGQAAGIVCPIPPCAPFDQVVALVRMVGAKVLVAARPEVSQDLWHKVELLRREVESINVVLQVQGPGNERDTIYAFDALLADYQDSRLLTRREIDPDDIAIYFHSRDTTGATRLRASDPRGSAVRGLGVGPRDHARAGGGAPARSLALHSVVLVTNSEPTRGDQGSLDKPFTTETPACTARSPRKHHRFIYFKNPSTLSFSIFAFPV